MDTKNECRKERRVVKTLLCKIRLLKHPKEGEWDGSDSLVHLRVEIHRRDEHTRGRLQISPRMVLGRGSPSTGASWKEMGES